MPTADSPGVMGSFAWSTGTGEWSWDAGMYELHGYPPGAVQVDVALVLEHKVQEDRARAESVMAAAARGDVSFSNYHRIVDVRGRQRTVLVVGTSRVAPSRQPPPGQVAAGFMIDVTADERASTRDAVERSRRGSAPIQQSMGLLMGTLRLDEAAAFALLARVSSHHNVKVRDVARRFMEATTAHAAEQPRDLTDLLLSQARALACERTHARSLQEPAGPARLEHSGSAPRPRSFS